MDRAYTGCLSLEGDGDDDDSNNDEFRCTCPMAHPPNLCMSLGDTQLGAPNGPVLFSFNPSNDCMVKDDREKNRAYTKRLSRHALELKEDAQEPFYKDLKMSSSLSEEEDSSWTRTYYLPVHKRKLMSRAASMLPCGSYGSYQYGTEKPMGTDSLSPWAHPTDPLLSNPENTKRGEPHSQHKESIGDMEIPSLQVPNRVLWEENKKLHRMVQSMQSCLESQAHSMCSLECQMKASVAKEKRRAQRLQALNQQTEHSLQLMTQRALEAENHVKKLKQEMVLLQGELEAFKLENESLRMGQSTNLKVVKHNVDFALENIQKILRGANWTIKQLVAGTELLNFVSEVLKSTDKISDAGDQ
ncbi:endosome-associated-trafficking regulator 1-like [Cyrtonyx montezumae]|uniref:endosome-associated-trafficking regulator 1-like n=1 Tax=Cyrtonyx montezumae TaxID=9017 RepID=UPI0032DB3A58